MMAMRVHRHFFRIKLFGLFKIYVIIFARTVIIMGHIKESILKFFVNIYYRLKFKIVSNYNVFNPKIKDPYFLIGNHSFLHD